MNLLLLEDDEDLDRAVRDPLAAAGHPLQWCRCIADAETAAPWAMTLLDLQLGDGDGYGLDLLRRWRRAGRRPPMIVLTGRDQVSDRIRGLQAGADDDLAEPFDLNELRAGQPCRRAHHLRRQFRCAGKPLSTTAGSPAKTTYNWLVESTPGPGLMSKLVAGLAPVIFVYQPSPVPAAPAVVKVRI